jgi:hypothetical protein
MQKLNLLWPSESLRIEMNNNLAIRKARECLDFIAWENAFISFCLDNCGNADMNVKAAEETLESLKMKGHDLISYVKAFRTAAENCKRCKYSFSEKRIVEMFIRNLNQADDAFFRFSIKILDSADALYELTLKPLEHAIAYIEGYFKKVIVPDLANKRSQNPVGSIRSIGDLRNLLSSGDNKNSSASVPLPILAAMLKKSMNNNNSNTNNNNNNTGDKKSRKRKANADNTADKSGDKSVSNSINPTTIQDTKVKVEPPAKKVCYSFAEKGSCHFGDRCYFEHVKKA